MTKIRGRNEGSIWREGKKHRAAISLDGRRVTGSFDTKQECRLWLKDMLTEKEEGLTINSYTISLDQYLLEWLSIHRARLKPKSFSRYQQLAKDYLLPSLGKHKLRGIKLREIEFLYQKLLERGVSPRNVRYVHSLLHRSLNDAVKQGLVSQNASDGARLPKLPYREMEILDENQVLTMLIAAKDSRLEALLHVAIKTGMRQGEILALKWSDLDWTRGTIIVNRQV